MSRQSDMAEIEEDWGKGKTPKVEGFCFLKPGHIDEESCDCHQNCDGELSKRIMIRRKYMYSLGADFRLTLFFYFIGNFIFW